MVEEKTKSSPLSWILPVVIVILAFLSGVLIRKYWNAPANFERSIKGASIDSSYIFRIFQTEDKQNTLLSGRIGVENENSKLGDCSGPQKPNQFCIETKGRQLMKVVQNDLDGGICYTVYRNQQESLQREVRDCFSLTHAHWYGGFQHPKQPWPLEKIDLKLTPYVSADSFFHEEDVGGLIDRYFINSRGVGIHIEDDVPLHVSINQSGDGQLCLVAKAQGYPFVHHDKGQLQLNYTVCTARNIRKVHQLMSGMIHDFPSNVPDERMFRHPVWSTWAQYNRDINESLVLEFAKNIIDSGFSHSQIEIDDDWTPFYGDHDFNLSKFPNPAKMIKTLNDLGFRVTTWVHPFMETDSAAFKMAAKEGYAVMTPDRSSPALVKWWNGDKAAMLDVTNPQAVDWFLSLLQNLKSSYKVSSFKFDAGEAMFYPQSFSNKVKYLNPDTYARLWSDLAYRADMEVRHQEVRVGWSSQKYPIFVRLFDRMSTWGYDTGLKTVIPAVLTFGILGYPFVLPDMIGGNAYVDMITFKGGAYPERDLFIRWLQVNTLLPAVQFSIVPSIYDSEVVKIAKSQMDLRAKYTDKIIALAKQSVKSGDPIIRPVWWICPEDPVALVTDSQFLLGDDLLVAPVLDKGANSRDIYIPEGIWEDQLTGKRIHGPKWLTSYHAELSDLPHFQRQG